MNYVELIDIQNEFISNSNYLLESTEAAFACKPIKLQRIL